MHELGAYLRDPDFNGMHVETWFVRPLNAVLARNRLLHDPATHRMSHEICFHAGELGTRHAAGRLRGFADPVHRPWRPAPSARPRRGAPRAARTTKARSIPSIPAASLTVSVDAAAQGEAEIRLRRRARAARSRGRQRSRAFCGMPPHEAGLRTVLGRKRLIDPGPPAARHRPGRSRSRRDGAART